MELSKGLLELQKDLMELVEGYIELLKGFLELTEGFMELTKGFSKQTPLQGKAHLRFAQMPHADQKPQKSFPFPIAHFIHLFSST